MEKEMSDYLKTKFTKRVLPSPQDGPNKKRFGSHAFLIEGHDPAKAFARLGGKDGDELWI